MIASLDQQEGVPVYARAGMPPHELVGAEWVLANGLGGYAMGTAAGMPTRRYHGLLVAALAPPVRREVMLHSIADSLVVEPGGPGQARADLTPFAFRGAVWSPGPPESLVRFEKGAVCRWLYQVRGVELTKEVLLHRERNAVSVSYRLRTGGQPVLLVLRPLVAMRDAHGLLHAGDPSGPRPGGPAERGVTVVRGPTRLELWADGGQFHPDAQWWHAFEYARELERGFEGVEDLFSPGVFTLETSGEGEAGVSITAWVGDRPRRSAEEEAREEEQRLKTLAVGATGRAPAPVPPAGEDDREAVRRLAVAADAFVAHRWERRRALGQPSALATPATTVIAGFPWFTDWGRDAMISLPGLLLATGRHDEALAVLVMFARHRRRGLIPNHFDEWTGEPRYNSADAPLWFLHAACEYLRASGDRAGFAEHLRPACAEIIEAYAAGTDYGIRVDPRDGLVMAGDPGTQLTWMDAQRDGVVFTPRHGKPVELSALWHHGLRAVGAAIMREEPERGARLLTMARRCADHFGPAFWDQAKQCLFDVLHPGPGGSWVPNDQVRPNQVFAASLEHSPLDERQRRAVVQCVRARLLTPHGLRTLGPGDPAYIGRFEGPIARRDAAYHNGTVWPWLMGPFAEAVLRVGGFSAAARAEARALLGPLVARLDGESLGQLPEVFDGDDAPDAPQRPGGCIAQAWSVAEVLRVLLMTIGA